MAIYTNSNPNSVIASVEFSPVPGRNASYFHLKEGSDAESVKQWIAQTLGQGIEAETNIGKEIILITRGDKGEAEVVAALKSRGDNVIPPEAHKKVNLWKLRGLGSIIGQPLQFFSSWLQPKGLDTATMGFAISNMAANLINVFFGAQKEKDRNHLRYIKREINARLANYLPEGKEPIDIEDKRYELHNPPQKKSLGNKVHDTIARYSVTGGDIGLRYIGAISLFLPLTKENPATHKYDYAHWKSGSRKLGEGFMHSAKLEFDKAAPAFKEAANKLINNDRATKWAGLMYIGGKALSLTSKVPDPYNKTRKHTWVDTLREKVVFPISSVIEASAAGIIALDRLNVVNWKDEKGVIKQRKISFDKLLERINSESIPGWAPGG